MNRFAIAATPLLAPAMTYAEEAQTRLHVSGLTCPSCSYIVPTALKSVGSVEIAEFAPGEAEDGFYVLRHHDAVTDPDALIAAVTDVGHGTALASGSGS